MFTALEWTTGAKVIVKPIAIRRPNDAYEMLLIADKTTGRGVWFDTNDCEWYINLQGVDGNLMQEAEVVEDVYGENEEEWETVANKLLAEYGLKLGDFASSHPTCRSSAINSPTSPNTGLGNSARKLNTRP